MSRLDTLRQQPKSIKNQYAFGGAVIVTSVIALLWAVALPDVLSSRAPEVAAEAEDQAGLTSEFFAEVGAGMANIFSAFTASTTGSASEEEQNTASSTLTPTAPTFSVPALVATGTTDQVSAKTPVKPTPKRILIATTSIDSLESE